MSINNNVITRFAPSPTGFLHIGNIRTALYNWLYAQSKQGKFILRIEDTDLVRSKDIYIKSIIESMKWLGLNWDKGPNLQFDKNKYFQSERTHIYQKYLNYLQKKNLVYKCFCSKERLDKLKEEAYKQKKDMVYDGTCKSLSKTDIQQRIDNNHDYVLRIKNDNSIIKFEDKLKGNIQIDLSRHGDFIVAKSDKRFLYNFTVVIDDYLMKITDVIRGEDHLINTGKQLFLYKLFNWTPPNYVHLPLIKSKDKKTLSKRDGVSSLNDLKEKYYLPEAILNAVLLLGWSESDSKQIYTIDEMIEKFDIKLLSKTPAVFDIEKLDWINAQHIQMLNMDEKIRYTLEYFNGVAGVEAKFLNEIYVKKVLEILGPRLKKVSDIETYTKSLFMTLPEYDNKLIEQIKNDAVQMNIINESFDLLSKIEDYSIENIESEFRSLCERLNIKLRKLVQPIRIVLTGQKVSAGLFETINVLGKLRTLQIFEYFTVLT